MLPLEYGRQRHSALAASNPLGQFDAAEITPALCRVAQVKDARIDRPSGGEYWGQQPLLLNFNHPAPAGIRGPSLWCGMSSSLLSALRLRLLP